VHSLPRIKDPALAGTSGFNSARGAHDGAEPSVRVASDFTERKQDEVIIESISWYRLLLKRRAYSYAMSVVPPAV